jgi:hypothetical protein
MESQGKGNAEELKRQWAAKRDAACRMGTRVHETAEATLQGLDMPYVPESDHERALMAAAWEYCQKILNSGKVTVAGIEKIVFSPKYMVAGQIDLIGAKDIDTGDQEYYLWDWKTNAEITMSGFNGRCALGPLAHLQDCKFTKYAMQLNVYERILREENYLWDGVVIKKALLHITSGGVKYISVPDMPLETAAVMGDERAQHDLGEGLFIEYPTKRAMRQVQSIEREALQAGWTREALYRNRDNWPFPGGHYGVVCHIGPETRIGRIYGGLIELVHHNPDKTFSLQILDARCHSAGEVMAV